MFKKSLLPCVMALALLPAQAQAPLDIRVALVIGNSSYANSPLANPVNDAKAMSAELKSLGFDVIEVRDAQLAQMRDAVASMGKKLAGMQGVALFYYAGHGLQINWHNYLVPVTAQLSTAAAVSRETLDVGEVVEMLKTSKSRVNIVVLDACRDNPFAGQSSGRGLAQMDAPPGTLLAYATSPGNVAEDGLLGNGLYTHYLLGELRKPAVKIEDIFKRTRLAVRRASGGRQIPWESTSLEEDFYFQSPPKSSLSPEALEKLYQLQSERWGQIQKSTDLLELTEFLSEFPTGPFSELAQFRFNRLYRAQVEAKAADEARQAAQARVAAEVLAAAQAKVYADARVASEKRAQEQAQAEVQARLAAERQAKAQTDVRTAAEVKALLEARAAAEARVSAMVQATQQARAAEEANALSHAKALEQARLLATKKAEESRAAAQVAAIASPVPLPAAVPEKLFNSTILPMQRSFKIGAKATYTENVWSTKSNDIKRLRVTGGDDDTVQLNNGKVMWDRMGNLLANRKGGNSAPRQFYPAEFQVGKRWQTRYVRSDKAGDTEWVLDVKVAGRERIAVPAGEFDTFVIKIDGWRKDAEGQRWVEWKIWVDPAVSFDIAQEFTRRTRSGKLDEMTTTKLVELSEPK